MFVISKKQHYLLQLSILLSCLFLSGCARETKQQTEETILVPENEKYETVAVRKGDYVSTFSSEADIIYDAVEVVSDKEICKFSKFLVNRHDKVKEGDILAVLESDNSTLELEEKQLVYEQNKEQYALDSNTMNESILLQEQALEQMPEGIEKEIAVIKLEKAKIQFELVLLQNMRNLEQQKQEIDQLDKKIKDNNILAPMDGIFLERAELTKGDKVKPGDTICRMVSEKQIYLGVPDKNGELRYNMEVAVTSSKYDGNSRTYKAGNLYQGRITYARNIAPDYKWKDMAYFALEDPISYLDLQKVIVTTDVSVIKNILLLDSHAVNSKDIDYVSIVEDGQIKMRTVKVGKKDNDKAWILQGLSENQAVIINQ